MATTILRAIWKVTLLFLFLAAAILFLFQQARAEQLTLSSCLRSRGLVLGTVESRVPLALSYGIQNYTGTAKQNTELANRICEGGLEEGSELLGAGYAPVTGYQTLTTTRVSAADTTIPVASVTDKAGNTIIPADISSSSTVRMYFNFEPGTPREEPFYCTGISGLNLTGCVRGISFQGSSLTGSSTIAQIHNAGAKIIMTNLGVFYGNEFVATTGDQDIFGAKTFKSATTTFGVGSSGIVYFPATGKLGYKNDGASTFTFDAGSSGLTASTTKSIFIDASQIGVNASTSRGLFQDPVAGTYNGYLGVHASNTQGLTFGSGGDLQFDPTANLILTGNVTSSGSLRATYPVTPYDVVIKSYSDQSTSQNIATGTASGTVTAGRAVYAISANTFAHTNTSAGTSTFQYVGVAITGASGGNTFTYAKPGGINCGQTGLTVGSMYYLNGTAGEILSTPASDRTVIVGKAISTTCIQLESGVKIAKGYTSHGATVAGSSYVHTQLGFRPSAVFINVSSTVTGSTSDGNSWGNLTFVGNSQVASNCFNENDDAATALTSANIASIPGMAHPFAGCYAKSAGGNRAELYIWLTDVTDSGFTTRLANNLVAGAGGSATARMTFMAIQ